MASPDMVSDSLITFACKLYERVVISQDRSLGNTFLSPLSIYTALSMVMMGSDGTTKDEILTALQLPKQLGTHEGHETLGKTLLGFFKPTDGVQVSIANRLFVDKSIEVVKDYQEALLKCYDGMVENLTISANPEAARSHINSWVLGQTMSKIEDLIPSGSLTAGTLAVLANALYFKGMWESQFKKEDTREGDFQKLDGSRVKVQFMNQKCSCKLANPVLSASRMIRIPFAGSKWEMMILLPNSKDGLPQLLKDISEPGNLQSVLADEGFENQVQLCLPKFKLSGSSIPVVDHLLALGMKTAFSTAGDFSRITRTPLSISEIHHKAILEVDEQGATAAAASAFVMTRCMGPPPVHVDHPFFLMLVYDTNIPVFMGHVLEPESL